MVCNNQNSCFFFLICPSSSILTTRKHNISETGSVSALKWGGETPTLLGPLERANLNHGIFNAQFVSSSTRVTDQTIS
jgi:hypothetical protein